MKNTKNKLKLIEICQRLKKNVISYEEAKDEINDIDKNNYVCCDNISLTDVKDKYPAGLPIESIEITYCENCGSIHDVVW